LNFSFLAVIQGITVPARPPIHEVRAGEFEKLPTTRRQAETMSIKQCGIAVLLLIALVAPLTAEADSSTVSYQGLLRNADGSSVADANYAMEFSIWDAATAGTQLWLETHALVPVKDGAFSVPLGASAALGTLFADHSALWLQIAVNTGPGIEVYDPRVPLTSVPYAKKADQATSATNATNATNAVNATNAGNADTVDSKHASDLALSTHTHNLQSLGGAVTDAQVPNDITIIQSGVSEVCFSGAVNGNQTVDCRVAVAQGSNVEITACFNHAGFIGTYGCSRKAFAALNEGWAFNADSVRDIERYDSPNGGYWEFYREAGNILLIRKTAGTYGGNGYYFVTVKGASNLVKQ
jgi:hypothetical protein